MPPSALWGLGLAFFLSAARARARLPRISLKQLPSKHRIFVDEVDRPRQFHGVSVVVQGPPWLPSRDGFNQDTSLVQEDFVLMREAGINVIRLGLIWRAAEPLRGKYNEDYFTQIKELVDEAAHFGIYVLVDMHQKAYSESFCGVGLPDWTINTRGLVVSFPEPFLARFSEGGDGYPTRQDCARLEKTLDALKLDLYATPSLQTAAQHLFLNDDGLADAWGRFLAKVAQELGGCSSVIGINLITHPYPSMVWGNISELLPSVSNRILQNAYDIVAAQIRNVNRDILLFFPGVNWLDNQFQRTTDGFSHPPGGTEWAEKSVYAFAFDSTAQQVPAIDKFVVRNAERLATGLFLTETNQAFEAVTAAVEVRGTSWTSMAWKPFCRESSESRQGPSQWANFGACKDSVGGVIFNSSGLQSDQYQLHARMYAPALQGTLQHQSFDPSTMRYKLIYELNPAIRGATEIFAHRGWHGGPDGQFQISVNPENVVRVGVQDISRGVVAILLAARPGQTSRGVAVTVEPGQSRKADGILV